MSYPLRSLLTNPILLPFPSITPQNHRTPNVAYAGTLAALIALLKARHTMYIPSAAVT